MIMPNDKEVMTEFIDQGTLAVSKELKVNPITSQMAGIKLKLSICKYERTQNLRFPYS